MIAVCVSKATALCCIFIVPPGSKCLFSPLFCHSDRRRRTLAVDLSCHFQPPWVTVAPPLTLAFIPVLQRPPIGLGG